MTAWLGERLRSGALAVRGGWLVALVLALYGASAFVVPTLAPVAINDDFLYARSAGLLAETGELRIFPQTVSTLVLQFGWGAAWMAVFGESFGVLRASTVAFSLVAGWAMYGLCRELGVDRIRSALGTAVVVFNPLAYALSFSFMSDSYLTGLVTVSVWCFVRGLRGDHPDAWWITLGSVAASMAFLVRHAGALVPLGVITWLLVSRRLRLDRDSMALVARVALLPAFAVLGHTLWFRASGNTSGYSSEVAGDVAASASWGTATLAHRLLAIGATYLGFFVLPLVVAALPRLPDLARRMPRSGLVAAAVVLGALATTVVHFSPFQDLFPWAPQFLSHFGAGPVDLRGGRPSLVRRRGVQLALGLCLLSAIVLVVVLARQAHGLWERRGSPAGLVAGVLVWQAVGAIGPSIVLRDTVLSFDRYFLPILPLGVALALWALRDVRIAPPAAWGSTIFLAVLAVAGTRDHLVLQTATWELAAQARADGIAVTQLDAGPAWDGTVAYGEPNTEAADAEGQIQEPGNDEPGNDEPAPVAPLGPEPGEGDGSIDDPVRLSPRDVAPWWLGLYAPTIDPEFVVAGDELLGHEVLRRVEVSSWLHQEPTHLYLLRRLPPAPP